MDGVLLAEWVRKMEKNFVFIGRKIALVINNCPAHPQIKNLKLIKLQWYMMRIFLIYIVFSKS